MSGLAARLHPVTAFAKQHLRLVKSHIAKKFESEVRVDPDFSDMLATFHESREAFERAEAMFWNLRVQCEELRFENELLKEQLREKTDQNENFGRPVQKLFQSRAAG